MQETQTGSESDLNINRKDTLEIEVNTHCNWRCLYCPERRWPKEADYMDMGIFRQIIKKAAAYGIQYVSFNAYNEPLLDQSFCEKVEIVSTANLKLILYTNGSLLFQKEADFLYSSQATASIRFNMPSIQRSEFERLTGSVLFDQTIENIEYSISRGLNVELLVNGTVEDIKTNFGPIVKRYGGIKNVKVLRYETSDRAGILTNEYAQNYVHKGRMKGCHQPDSKLCVNIKGDFYICCMDYFQRYIYGNIVDGEISDILLSQRARKLFAQISGEVPIPNDFICKRCIAAGFSRFFPKKK